MNATRVRITEFKARKSRGEKIAMLTAYDAIIARLLESAGVDMLLVGDSVGMASLGYESTLPVTLDMMVHHTAAVIRGTQRALVVADMPFLTYQASIEDAVRNAGRLLQEGGAAAVKLEGGYAISDVVRRLVQVGIPVMGHVGLLPQSVNQMGGYRKRGTQPQEVLSLFADALALQEAGAFAVVLESIPSDVAARITSQLEIPTIGIGAGPECSGQILVSYDMLGLFDQFVPPFVKPYANLAETIVTATRAYVDDVRSLRFPLEARPPVGARAGEE
jgi:3-methyl-2-oxobutanoate hydroxymethyltransferase